MMQMITDSMDALRRDELIRYFNRLSGIFYTHTTPDNLQGGISVIRHPNRYSTATLSYWYGECKRAGY